MSIDLVVADAMSSDLQPVLDQAGSASAVSLSSNAMLVTGQDIIGVSMPLTVAGLPVSDGQQSAGRILRLYNHQLLTAGMYDFAVDSGGNLQIYAGGQTSTSALTISPDGAVTIPNLNVTNLSVANQPVSEPLPADA